MNIRLLSLALLLLPFTLPAQQQSFPGAGGIGGGSTPITGQSGSVLYNDKGTAKVAPGFLFNPNTSTVSVPGSFSIASTGVAGNFQMPYGPLPIIRSGAAGWAAPSMGSSTGVLHITPGFPGGGVLEGFAGNGYVQYGLSGDANHSSGRITGITSSQPSTVVCTFSYCQKGSFQIKVHVSDAQSCGNGAGSGVQFFVTFTDDVGSKSTQLIPLTINGGTAQSASMPLGTASNWAWGAAEFNNSASSNIAYSVNITPCTSGTATINYDVEVIQTL